MENRPNLMTTKEAANYLRVHPMTVYRLCLKKQIPATKVGGRWGIPKDTLINTLFGETVE